MSAEVSSLGVALITGANRGIGRGIALRLAKDGYDVGINGRSTALESLETLQKEIIALGRRACIAIGDISVSSDVENMVSTVVEELGQLNVMVANAGISGKQGTPILQIEASDWDAVLSINSLGTFLSYKYAALQMIKQGKGGRIIGATSIFGKRGSAYSAPYSPSKFAICGLTQVAAQEWGSHGITVNAYSPGVIDTDMSRVAIEYMAAHPDADVGMQPCALGYHGTVDDVASLVSYLASKEAHFITGQCINVDGGRELS